MTSSFNIRSLKFCKLFSPCSITHLSLPSLFVHLFAGKTWTDVGYSLYHSGQSARIQSILQLGTSKTQYRASQIRNVFGA